MTCPPPEALSAVYGSALRSLTLCPETAEGSCDDGNNRGRQSGRRYACAVADNPPTAEC